MPDFQYKHDRILAYKQGYLLQRKCLECDYQEQIDETERAKRFKKFRLFSVKEGTYSMTLTPYSHIIEICDNCGNVSTYKLMDLPLFPIE